MKYVRPDGLTWDPTKFDLAEEYTVAEFNRRLLAAQLNTERNALNQYIPVKNTEEIRIVKIAAGMDFAMAIDMDGHLYTWGRNNVGQIGNGLRSNSQSSNELYYAAPVTVETFRELKNSADINAPLVIVDIATGVYNGSSYAMALAETGDLFVWGTGTNGQVGDTEGNDLLKPAKAPVSDIVDLAAASQGSSYALDQMGTLLFWSMANRSNMTVNTSQNDAGLRNMRDGGDRIVTVDAGHGDILAITKNNDVWVNGSNSSGQLGTGNRTDITTFTKSDILSGKNVKNLTGGVTTMVLEGTGFTGTLMAAGSNNAGQMGVGTTFDSNLFLNVQAGDTAGGKDDPGAENIDADSELRKQMIQGIVQADTAMGMDLPKKNGTARI